MKDYRSIEALSCEELDELKQAYVCEMVENASYGELADSRDIPDEVIFKHYAGVAFGPEDFFCHCGKEED